VDVNARSVRRSGQSSIEGERTVSGQSIPEGHTSFQPDYTISSSGTKPYSHAHRFVGHEAGRMVDEAVRIVRQNRCGVRLLLYTPGWQAFLGFWLRSSIWSRFVAKRAENRGGMEPGLRLSRGCVRGVYRARVGLSEDSSPWSEQYLGGIVWDIEFGKSRTLPRTGTSLQS